jgi:hypothetical protein
MLRTGVLKSSLGANKGCVPHFLRASHWVCSAAEITFVEIYRRVKGFVDFTHETLGSDRFAYSTERVKQVFIGMRAANECFGVLGYHSRNLGVASKVNRVASQFLLV